MIPRNRFLAAALALLPWIFACGGEGGARAEGVAKLAALGTRSLTLHPSDDRELQILLARDNAGPLRGARIEFSLSGGGESSAALEPASTETDASGIARVKLTAGDLSPGFQVVASAPDHPEALPVAFAVSVIPLRRQLEIVAAPGITVGAGGRNAQVALPAAGSARLVVRERDRDTGGPIAGDVLAFTLSPGARAVFSGNAGQATTAATNAAGDAQAFLLGSAQAESFLVLAGSLDGAAGEVSFAISVADPAPAPGCGGPFGGCAPGTTCVNGRCLPPGPGPEAGPDVSGLWNTSHLFLLDGALPAAVKEVLVALRVLDQALSGALGLPSWLQGMLASIVDQFVPSWVRTVVRIGDSLGTVLSNLRSTGSLRLRASTADRREVSGTEEWSSLVLYWLPLCCPGFSAACPAIAGDPEAPLACGRVDLAAAGPDGRGAVASCNGLPIPPIAIRAAPFQARVEGSGPGRDRGPWSLEVGPRAVDLRLAQVLPSSIDALLSLSTPWHCIEEATDCSAGHACIVDCAGIGQTLSHLTGGFAGAGALTDLCGVAVQGVGRRMTGALDKVTFDADAIEFGGHALIGRLGESGAACDSGRECAGQLGQDDFDARTRADGRNQTSTRDGLWEGSFFRRGATHMKGGWEARRAAGP